MDGAGKGFIPALLSFPGVLGFWIVYGVAHAVLRLSVSRTLTIDDARANELTQSLALGYQLRQPPLYEWLLWCVQQWLGPGLPSHLLVRYSLITLLGLATFGAVRAAVKDDRWAAVASLSLAFSYPVGWTFHEWGTQTLLLSIACMATIQAAVVFLERPSLGAAAFLGFALSLGFYAKFSYPLFLAGLVLAALSLPEARARLADRRLLVSLAILAVAFAPYAYWVVRVQGDVVAHLSEHMIRGTQSHVARATRGLGRLAVGIPTFLLPWILFVGLIAPKAFMPAARADAPQPSLAERIALRAMLFAVLVAAVGIAATGATNIGTRYLHPMLIIAPVYIFARIARLVPDAERIKAFAVLAVAVAATVFCIRFISFTDNPITRRVDRGPLMPYARLAEAIQKRGVTEGTVVTPDVREAGNLRAFLPQLRVTSADSLRVERPPRRESDERSCVLLWAKWQNGRVKDFLASRELTIERIDIAPVRSGILASGSGTWLTARLDPSWPVCH